MWRTVEGDDGGVDVSGVSDSTPVQSIFTKTCEMSEADLKLIREYDQLSYGTISVCSCVVV